MHVYILRLSLWYNTGTYFKSNAVITSVGQVTIVRIGSVMTRLISVNNWSISRFFLLPRFIVICLLRLWILLAVRDLCNNPTHSVEEKKFCYFFLSLFLECCGSICKTRQSTAFSLVRSPHFLLLSRSCNCTVMFCVSFFQYYMMLCFFYFFNILKEPFFIYIIVWEIWSFYCINLC